MYQKKKKANILLPKERLLPLDFLINWIHLKSFYREEGIMRFFSSICCCFYRPSRVIGDEEGTVSRPLTVDLNQTESPQPPILVPHFPVKPSVSRLWFMRLQLPGERWWVALLLFCRQIYNGCWILHSLCIFLYTRDAAAAVTCLDVRKKSPWIVLFSKLNHVILVCIIEECFKTSPSL